MKLKYLPIIALALLAGPVGAAAQTKKPVYPALPPINFDPLGDFLNHVAAIGQHLQIFILLIGRRVTVLFVKQLGRTRLRHLEIALR